jgi:DNA modification methylase
VIDKAGAIGGDRPIGNNFSKEARHRTGDMTPKTRAERAGLLNPLGRNLRNVWSINTKPYRDAHFATMAPELAQRCILAGCPEGGSVLDPFGGAGTTALVAGELGRRATLIELNPDYAEIARKRLGHMAVSETGVSKVWVPTDFAAD